MADNVKWWKATPDRIATFLAIVTYFVPALTVSAIAAGIVAIWSGALFWLEKPSVFVPALVFGYVFWVYTSIRPRFFRVSPDYEYSITQDGGWSALRGQFPASDQRHSHEAALFLICRFRNVCPAPIRIKIEEFRIVLDGRTFDESGTATEWIWARLAPKALKSPFIVRDTNKTNLLGTASVKILYGPVGGKFMRRYTVVADLEVLVHDASGAIGVMDAVIRETDEALHSPVS